MAEFDLSLSLSLSSSTSLSLSGKARLIGAKTQRLDRPGTYRSDDHAVAEIDLDLERGRRRSLPKSGQLARYRVLRIHFQTFKLGKNALALEIGFESIVY